MARRIFVFEADKNWSDELKARFGQLGVHVDVVADGNAGVDQAAANPPDLILLSVELPSMNGFLVCKKIKKTPPIAEVPLIILSSDGNADEIFEQHKKLRTRAEDYVKKPVSFETLLGHVRNLIPIEEPAGGGGDQFGSKVDDEIEAFAESAFDSIFMEDSVPAKPAAAAAPAPAPSEATSTHVDSEIEADLEDIVIEDELTLETEEPEPVAEVAPPVRPATVPPRAPTMPPPRAPTMPPPAPSVRPPSVAVSLDAAEVAALRSELESARARASRASRRISTAPAARPPRCRRSRPRSPISRRRPRRAAACRAASSSTCARR